MKSRILLIRPRNLEYYADVVHRKEAPLDNCFGFVDGTDWPISRPECNQRIVHNGLTRVHAIKFQSVVISDGMINNMFGPVGGYFRVFAFQYLCLLMCLYSFCIRSITNDLF